MRECPTPVLLLSSHTRAGADITLRALEAGAVDFVDKSGAATSMDIHELAPILREKVCAALRARTTSLAEPAPAVAIAPVRETQAPPRSGSYEVLVVGASTGGPLALAELLPALPAGFAAGIVVAQHMPTGFTGTLAERLDRRAGLRVSEAADGDPVLPGRALIAPGGKQIRLERGPDGVLRVRVWEEPGLLHRPSVDLLFESAAKVAGRRAVGVILTGMGNDGAAGLARIREAGGGALTESAETAVIDGMPAAARAVAERDVPLGKMAHVLTEIVGVHR